MNNLGLYLHVPFCKKKCAYCDFYSASDLSRKEAFVSAMVRHLRFFGEKANGKIVDTVYFGGGTPSLLTPNELSLVLSEVKKNFSLSPTAEITVEMNPDSVSIELLHAGREEGVNRISLGMQSSFDEELSRLGRLHRADATIRAVEMVRNAGVENLSLDLMYGLPEQSRERFMESLRICTELEPEHISFYCLTLSPEVPLFAESRFLPDDEELLQTYLASSSYLEEKGYEHYEISNAAKSGFRSRHNQKYWNLSEYLGIGPGAHSDFGGERFAMAADTERFLKESDPIFLLEEREKIGREERNTEYLMLSLRTRDGVKKEEILSRFGKTFYEKMEDMFSRWEKEDLCRKTETGFALTPKGFFVSNEMISELI